RVFAAEIAKLLVPLPQRVVVTGHTDNVPINTPEFPTNWDLSAKRALNFMKFLLAQDTNLKPERFSSTGLGEYHPLASNTSEGERAKNRRVEIMIQRAHTQR
ncbi:MAG: motB, partial [Firmicutes bacterium]|nr:motB [Bacillota bacterium]